MNNINWYIIKQLLGPLLFITFALTGVIWLSQSLQFVEKLINGLPISTFLYLSVLLIPSILKYTLLISLFLGTLFTFNRLYTESELVVMWAAGLSKWALTKPTIYLALIVAVFLYIFGFYLTPFGIRTVKDLRVEWRESLASVVLREGVFNSLSKDVTVYIREKRSTGELLGILVHDERNPAKPITYMAEQGAFIKTSAGPRFVMKNGNLQEVQKDKAKLSILYFDDYSLDVSQFEKKESVRWLKPGERYLHELLWPEQSEKAQQNSTQLTSELHQRIALPLFAIALVYISMAGVMGGEFSRRRQTRRLLIAGTSGISLLIGTMAIFSASKAALWLIPTFYIVPIIATILAAHLASGGKLNFRSLNFRTSIAASTGGSE